MLPAVVYLEEPYLKLYQKSGMKGKIVLVHFSFSF
jgi:hypothetical protein